MTRVPLTYQPNHDKLKEMARIIAKHEDLIAKQERRIAVMERRLCILRSPSA